MAEQAADVEPETEVDVEARHAERLARLETLDEELEELHAAATPECATAFESLSSFF